MASAKRKAWRLPLVSEITFMIKRPMNDPKGKIDWMITLAQFLPQYRPISATTVKSSTKFSMELTNFALLNFPASLFFVNDMVSLRRTMKQRVHVDEGWAEEDEDHADPGAHQESHEYFLKSVLTAGQLKGILEFPLSHLSWIICKVYKLLLLNF